MAGDVHFRRPDFFLFRDMGLLLSSKRPWAAVFVDEAHDLPDHAARTLKEASDQLGFYLVAACDRHQRLKLAGVDAKVINGFNFTNKSKRLRQVYRNPAPIYIASLALMFRWFAATGPKIIPTEKELKECFGFKVAKLAGQSARLSIKNDAHPANSWRHTVARFGDAASAAALLRREKLARDEVLWVRFSAEDPSFDYEALQHAFTYHNCRTEEAADLNDKYIKGQDYPVVVIEGFPRFMDQFDSSEKEDEMWAFRRELYLCASRATCFLFFICNVTASEEIDRIDEELDALLSQVSTPWENSTAGNGTREWSFLLKETGRNRTMAEFADAVQAASDAADLSLLEAQTIVEQSVKTQDPVPVATEATDLEEAPLNASRPEETQNEPKEELEKETEPPREDTPGEEPSVAIANAYGTWPIDQDLIPPYEWVLVVNESESARDFSERLGCTVPDLLGKLRKRGMTYATNTPIPIPVMRSLSFEFQCYPANSQMEHDALTSEIDKAEESDAEHGDHGDTIRSMPITQQKDAGAGPGVITRSPSGDNIGTRRITMKEPIIVSELAGELGLKPFVVLADLIKLQLFVAPNQAIEPQIAAKVCEIHGFVFEHDRR